MEKYVICDWKLILKKDLINLIYEFNTIPIKISANSFYGRQKTKDRQHDIEKKRTSLEDLLYLVLRLTIILQ